MLEKWREKFAFKAKYQTLVEALLAEGKSTDAIEACKVMGTAAAGECTNVKDVQSNQKPLPQVTIDVEAQIPGNEELAIHQTLN